MKKKIAVLVFMAFNAGCLCAQKTPQIQTDRPDQTESPSIVPAKHFQVETGFNYEKTDDLMKTLLLPTVLWKYGVNDNYELRLITEITKDKFGKNDVTGLSPVTVGIKAKLVEEKGIIPDISFVGQLSIPKIASPAFKTEFYAPEFRLSMQHTLSDKVTLGYNLGAEWDGETPEPTFIYTLTSGIAINKKLGTFIELYGFAPQKGKADHRADAGFTYLIKNNVMVDISGGVGLTENAPKFFVSTGFSFRLKD